MASSAASGIEQALWDITGKTYGNRCTSCLVGPFGTVCDSTPVRTWDSRHRRKKNEEIQHES